MIEINKIEKKFANKAVLNGVTLKIEEGLVYGLIGKNGAGKTTLISIITGLSDASAGECLIAGETIKRGKKIKTKIGYLPDLPAFYEYMTTGEFLDFLFGNCEIHEKTKKKKELLKLVGLEDKVKIRTMSRGMRQRLGIAATLVNNPDIIILDEPTSALDPLGRSELMEIISELKKDGKTIILSTHILTDMEKVCDKVAFLHEGVIKKSFSVDELQKKDAALKIVFDDEVQLNPYDDKKLQIEKNSNIEYVFRPCGEFIVDNQKYMLEYLSSLDTKINRIMNEIQSLDELFQEVCR